MANGESPPRLEIVESFHSRLEVRWKKLYLLSRKIFFFFFFPFSFFLFCFPFSIVTSIEGKSIQTIIVRVVALYSHRTSESCCQYIVSFLFILLYYFFLLSSSSWKSSLYIFTFYLSLVSRSVSVPSCQIIE